MSEKVEELSEAESCEHYEVEYCDEEEYYVKAFKRLNETGKNTWNWAAFLFGPAWMLYRKMYLYGTIFYMIFGTIQNVVVSTGSVFLAFFFSLGIRILYGYFGNSLYYRIVKKRIRQGYHLLDRYSPTSISAVVPILGLLVCFADWISCDSQLKTKFEDKIDEKTIRAYLNSARENPFIVKVVNGILWVFIAWCFLVVYNKI